MPRKTAAQLAETPRVGDTVRLTRVDGEVTTTVTGPALWDALTEQLRVHGYRCDPAPEGWSVEVIEREDRRQAWIDAEESDWRYCETCGDYHA